MIFLFFMLMLFCFLGALFFVIQEKPYQKKVDKIYNYGITSPTVLFFFKIPEWLLQISNMVPISLLVNLELVKFFQSKLLQGDKNFFQKSVNHGLQVNSSNLLEQMGQVTHIVTDKTGTLTSNLMKFQCLTVGQTSYGDKGYARIQKGSPLSQRKNSENQYIDFNDESFFKEL